MDGLGGLFFLGSKEENGKVKAHTLVLRLTISNAFENTTAVLFL